MHWIWFEVVATDLGYNPEKSFLLFRIKYQGVLMSDANKETYPLIELSIGTSDVAVQEAFWVKMFGGKVIFRGQMMGLRFSRLIVCGVTIVFREDPGFQLPPGPGEERLYNNHIGLRVHDLDRSIDELESRGAEFVLKPAMVRELLRQKNSDGPKMLETDYIAPPLTAERLANGECKIDVAILVGPDNLWIELNQITEPEDTNWFPW
jgi:catechol 2,3-dioxygenase-like lactoylglutathione lyase family enzyme